MENDYTINIDVKFDIKGVVECILEQICDKIDKTDDESEALFTLMNVPKVRSVIQELLIEMLDSGEVEDCWPTG